MKSFRVSLLWAVAMLAAFIWMGCPTQMQIALPVNPLGEKVPERWKDEPVFVLSDSSIFRYEPHGTVAKGANLEVERVTWYWIRKRTPEVLANLPLYDFETVESIPEVRVKAIFADGSTWEKTSLFTRTNVPEEGLAASNRFVRFVAIPRYAANTLVRLQVKRRYIRPEFVAGETWRGPFPIVSRHVIIQDREGANLKVGMTNSEGLLLQETSTHLPTGEVMRTWSCDSLARLDLRSPLTDPLSWYAAVRISCPLKSRGKPMSQGKPPTAAGMEKPVGPSLPTWADLGDHYLALAEASMQPSPALKAFAQSLGQAPDDTLIARAFAALGKRLRYHADEEKLHAFIPRSAETIFARGYGDCKEMSLLLHLVLQERGIESRLALTAAPPMGQASPDFPTLGGFNHMVLAVPGLGGKIWRFLDPTLGEWPAYRSTLNLAGRRALLLAPSGQSQFVIIPAPEGPAQEIMTKNSVREKAGGQWTLEGFIELRGLASQYPAIKMRGLGREEKSSFLKFFLKESFGLLALSQEIVVNEPDCLRIQYTADFTSQYLQLDKGGFSLELPTLFGGRTGYTTVDWEGPREFKSILQNDSWILPNGFNELEGQGMNHSLAKATFTRGKGEIKRQYEGFSAKIPRGDSVISKFQKEYERLHRVSVWRKN